MGDEGNLFHRTLVLPSIVSLFQPRPGETVLDVGCGTGTMSRWLARAGLKVLGVDASAGMLERARARGENVEYRQLDVSDVAELHRLPPFDGIVCSMAWMDMPHLDPLLRMTRQLLKPGGRMVAALCHPCFNLEGARLVVEQEDARGQLVTRSGVTVFDYLTPRATAGTGAPGEPNAHTYYHRPLQDLLGRCFAAGLVLDGLLEPAFLPSEEPVRPTWYSLPGIPPVLALRLRPRDT